MIEIIRNWKKKRQDRKQAKHEKLLVELAEMVVGLLGNENPDLNRFTLVTPKPANGVRLQATLDNQNPTGLPVGAVRKEVEKISAYTGVSEEAAYNLFLNGYDVPSELDGQKIAFSESELTPDLLSNLAENNVRSVKVMSDESIATGYMDYLHKQKKDNKF